MSGNLADQSTGFFRHIVIFRLSAERLFQFGDVVQEQRLVADGNRDDMVEREVAQDTGFDLYFFDIDFPFHFVAGFQFLFAQYAGFLEHPDDFRFQVSIVLQRNAVLAIQAAAGSFFLPFVAIAVSVEADRFGFFDVGFQHFEDGGFLALPFGTQCLDILFELAELVGDGRVQCQHRRAAVGRRSQCTEFETVSGESKRRGAVTVRIV